MKVQFLLALVGTAFLSCLVGAQNSTLKPTDAVATGLAHRPSIASALSQVEAAFQARRVLGAYPGSRIEAGTGTRPDIQGGEDFLVALPLDIFGRSRTGRRQGTADLDLAQANFRQAELDVQSQVLRAYIALAKANEFVTIAATTRQASEDTKAATDKLLAAQKVPEIQDLRVEIEAKRARQDFIDREAARNVAARGLESAMGAGLGSYRFELGMISLPAKTPDRRPDIEMLEAELNRAKSDQEAAKQLALPTLEAQFRRSPWSESEQYGARLQFVMPLWDDGSNRAALASARAKVAAAERALEDKKAVAAKEVESAEIELAAASTSLKEQADIVTEARDVMSKVEKGYELGALTVLDVFDARRTLTESLQAQTEAEARYELAVVDLLEAHGVILAEVKP